MLPCFGNEAAIMKRILLLYILIACGFSVEGQDIHLSQFSETPLWRNPSLAGIFTGDVRAQAVFRSQWGSVTVPYNTVSANAEYKLPVGNSHDFLTLGVQVMYDKAGSTNFQTLHFYPVINYHKSLSGNKNSYLSLGFMGGMVQRSIDRSKITTNSQYDGSGYNQFLDIDEPLTQFSKTYGDASVGLSFNSSIGGSEYDNFFVGLAYHHFNKPSNAFYKNPRIELKEKWVVSGGLKVGITERSYLTVLADYNMQGPYREIIGGGMIGYAIDDWDITTSKVNFHTGAFIRWQDAIIPMIRFDFLPFSATLSYDINISPLKTVSQSKGGFELSMAYIGFLDRYNSAKNAVLCPRF